MDQIQHIRRFNRLVTQRIGVLQSNYLGQGRPLGEARLLFEIGEAGADIRELRTRLDLDSGYVSRILRALEGQGLLTVGKSPADGRVRIARLTPKGVDEVRTYDALSDNLARSLVEPLDEAQRTRLVAAMGEVERLLRASSVTLHVEPPAGPDARACVASYLRELSQRFDTGYDPKAAAPTDDAQFTPPLGVFIVARLEGRAVGCGALKRPGLEIGEIKRLWIDPDTRGLGLGRKLLTALEDAARDMGLTHVRLDSNRALTEAIALYKKCGYSEVARFNDDPYAQMWFEKPLP